MNVMFNPEHWSGATCRIKTATSSGGLLLIWTFKAWIYQKTYSIARIPLVDNNVPFSSIEENSYQREAALPLIGKK